jgi:hypothetical protein
MKNRGQKRQTRRVATPLLQPGILSRTRQVALRLVEVYRNIFVPQDWERKKCGVDAKFARRAAIASARFHAGPASRDRGRVVIAPVVRNIVRRANFRVFTDCTTTC